MAETKKTEGLMYRNHPLLRIDTLIYYGSMADKYIVMFQILDAKKEQDLDVATRVSVQLQLTEGCLCLRLGHLYAFPRHNLFQYVFHLVMS